MEPPSLTLLLSPSLRQSSELFKKVTSLFNALGRPVPVVQESALQMQLANGSRIVSLPGEESTVRGYSGVGLLIIDEAARVPDELYRAVRPMLAVSQGRLVCLSTPFAKAGWFYTAWSEEPGWHRVMIRADECSRIPRDYLEAERKALGERWFKMEFMCEFADSVEGLFSEDDIRAMFSNDVQPLFTE
jgi:hypothetical protein